jgi:hypothetical protein
MRSFQAHLSLKDAQAPRVNANKLSVSQCNDLLRTSADHSTLTAQDALNPGSTRQLRSVIAITKHLHTSPPNPHQTTHHTVNNPPPPTSLHITLQTIQNNNHPPKWPQLASAKHSATQATPTTTKRSKTAWTPKARIPPSSPSPCRPS